jgi:hypothetical protein
VNVEFVNNSAFLQISTNVITHIDVLGAIPDDFRGDQSESSLTDAVDWQWWYVFAVNVCL